MPMMIEPMTVLPSMRAKAALLLPRAIEAFSAARDQARDPISAAVREAGARAESRAGHDVNRLRLLAEGSAGSQYDPITPEEYDALLHRYGDGEAP